MRNDWSRRGLAAYVSAAEQRALAARRVPVQRDVLFQAELVPPRGKNAVAKRRADALRGEEEEERGAWSTPAAAAAATTTVVAAAGKGAGARGEGIGTKRKEPLRVTSEAVGAEDTGAVEV